MQQLSNIKYLATDKKKIKKKTRTRPQSLYSLQTLFSLTPYSWAMLSSTTAWLVEVHYDRVGGCCPLHQSHVTCSILKAPPMVKRKLASRNDKAQKFRSAWQQVALTPWYRRTMSARRGISAGATDLPVFWESAEELLRSQKPGRLSPSTSGCTPSATYRVNSWFSFTLCGTISGGVLDSASPLPLEAPDAASLAACRCSMMEGTRGSVAAGP